MTEPTHDQRAGDLEQADDLRALARELGFSEAQVGFFLGGLEHLAQRADVLPGPCENPESER